MEYSTSDQCRQGIAVALFMEVQTRVVVCLLTNNEGNLMDEWASVI